MAASYVMVAAVGFALGALAGRWMMGEMRNALGAIQLRLAALEHTVVGNGTAANSAAAAPNHNPVSAAPVHSIAPMATAPMAMAQQQPASASQPAPVAQAAPAGIKDSWPFSLNPTHPRDVRTIPAPESSTCRV